MKRRRGQRPSSGCTTVPPVLASSAVGRKGSRGVASRRPDSVSSAYTHWSQRCLCQQHRASWTNNPLKANPPTQSAEMVKAGCCEPFGSSLSPDTRSVQPDGSAACPPIEALRPQCAFDAAADPFRICRAVASRPRSAAKHDSGHWASASLTGLPTPLAGDRAFSG